MRYIIWILFLHTFYCQGQGNILFVGNTSPICIASDSNHIITKSDYLPDSISHYEAVFIFSGAVTCIQQDQIVMLLNYIDTGHGLYCGADNSPLQEEFNQLSDYLFAKTVWGNFTTTNATLADNSFITSKNKENIYAGETTVAVPLDARVKVEAWIDDEPIITSLVFGKGKIVFDGGYSRFFCNQTSEEDAVLEEIIQFLIK